MNSPRCASSAYCKAGFSSNKRQRYKCKHCNYYYTVAIKSTAKPLSFRHRALCLYLEGMGFRQIGRALNVSHVSVYRWIRQYGSEVSLPDNDITEPIPAVELDELHSYVGKKKTIAGYG